MEVGFTKEVGYTKIDIYINHNFLLCVLIRVSINLRFSLVIYRHVIRYNETEGFIQIFYR